ncbi:hypothetical protein [Mycolicibacterium neworleansense]|nr:hypothetical protein [Mycolicibacterium neworleansense]
MSVVRHRNTVGRKCFGSPGDAVARDDELRCVPAEFIAPARDPAQSGVHVFGCSAMRGIQLSPSAIEV